MGVVPHPPPPGLSRAELIEYRDYLEWQRQQLPFANLGKVEFPSSDFQYTLLILSPWIISVAIKLWTGAWRWYLPPPHW